MYALNSKARNPLALYCFLGIMMLWATNSASGQSLDVPQDRYVEINGLRLHYLDWGGDGQVMLLIHGLWGTAHWYNELASYFTDRYRVLGLTRRDHGASQKDTGPISMDSLVDDISDFLNLFTTDSAVVVGHSYAGVEIPRLAHQHPEQVASIVLLDAVYDWKMWRNPGSPLFPTRWDFPGGFGSFDEMDRWFESTYAQVWGEALSVALRSQTYLDSDGAVSWQLPWASERGFEFQEPQGDWSGNEFANLGLPILSIQADFGGFFEREFDRWQIPEQEQEVARAWAEFDAEIKRVGKEQLMRVAPQAEHRMLEHTHHWLFTQRPLEVAELMNEFLGRN